MNRYIWEIVSRYCSEEYRVSVFLQQLFQLGVF